MSLEEVIFKPARESLLEKQDGREKLIRSCREITSYSKKAIFTLHRTLISQQIVIKELTLYLEIMGEHLNTVKVIYMSNQSLRGSISGAIEEMIEFFTFGYYKYHGKLILYTEFVKSLNMVMEGNIPEVVAFILNKSELKYNSVEKEGKEVEKEVEGVEEDDFKNVLVDQSDFLMGLFDCTGEIMRMVILQSTNNAGGLQMQHTLENYKFLKVLYEQYLILQTRYPGISIHHGSFDDAIGLKGNFSFKKKLEVFQSSIKKIETTLLDILISDKEIL
ncbi:translin family protein [Acetobacter pasteurianus]|nr:translin family protein [Acetobacter pasteurianus]